MLPLLFVTRRFIVLTNFLLLNVVCVELLTFNRTLDLQLHAQLTTSASILFCRVTRQADHPLNVFSEKNAHCCRQDGQPVIRLLASGEFTRVDMGSLAFNVVASENLSDCDAQCAVLAWSCLATRHTPSWKAQPNPVAEGIP